MSADARSSRSERESRGGALRALAVRLIGPLQAYGGTSVAVDRPTEEAPTKSAMMGLLGAALGIDRGDTSALVELDRSFALVVRVDSAGTALTDYHTVLEIPSLDGASIRKHATITRRTYLADAAFTVLFVQQSEALLERWHDALRYPRYAPVLGRRACPPAVPLVDRERKIVAGATWRALLNGVSVAESVMVWGARTAKRERAEYDVHMDEELCDGEDRALARRYVRRDRLVGPGPRMYWDRPVRVCRWAPDATSGDDAIARAGAREDGFEDRVTDRDTTEGYL